MLDGRDVALEIGARTTESVKSRGTGKRWTGGTDLTADSCNWGVSVYRK